MMCGEFLTVFGVFLSFYVFPGKTLPAFATNRGEGEVAIFVWRFEVFKVFGIGCSQLLR